MRILIADDHALTREGLCSALRELADDVTVVAAADGGQVHDLIDGQTDFNLILLDLFMPGIDGFDLLSKVCNRRPETPVVVLSASLDPADMRRSLDHGAAGFIQKSSGREVILSALRLVLAGGVYVPPGILGSTMPSLEGSTPVSQDPMISDLVGVAHELSLTNRQLDVLRLLAQGVSNKIIARHLGLSENTVKIHVAAILKAFNVNNRTQAVVLAQRMGAASLPTQG